METLEGTTKRPIQLKWDHGAVVITPQDNDKFVMASQRAVAACQGMYAFDRFIEQFKSVFLARLREWCEQHGEHVNACYVPYPFLSTLKVFIVARSPKYDFTLSDPIADLELELDRKGWPSDIVQLSAGSVEDLYAFFDYPESIQVYGDGSRSSSEG
jgi:hypothetical protein